MEEGFGEIEVEYAPLCEDEEIDSDYEFDAPQFFNFTRQEALWDAAEAEQWFEYATSYPPSPFVLKTRWRNCNGVKMSVENSGSSMEDNSTGLEYCKTKHLRKSSSSKVKDFSFMKPTASHLAKQKNSSEVQTPQSLSRIQRQNSSSTEGQLTKRQKLEAGYLSKVARLKHQTLFTHKKTKEGDGADVNFLASKSNVTVAKEPNFLTAQRAQRHKSKTNAESDGPTQSNSQVLKGRSLNKKILEGPAQISSKMKTQRPTEFQAFHLRTSQRAKQNTSNNNAGSTISNSETQDLKRTKSSVGSRQEKCKTNNKLSSKSERGVFRNIKVYPLEQNDNESLNESPSKIFSKMSLASEVKQTTKSLSKEHPKSKGLKENRPGSLHQEHENMKLVKEGIQRSCGKQYPCVIEMGSFISKQTCMLEIGH